MQRAPNPPLLIPPTGSTLTISVPPFNPSYSGPPLFLDPRGGGVDLHSGTVRIFLPFTFRLPSKGGGILLGLFLSRGVLSRISPRAKQGHWTRGDGGIRGPQFTAYFPIFLHNRIFPHDFRIFSRLRRPQIPPPATSSCISPLMLYWGGL